MGHSSCAPGSRRARSFLFAAAAACGIAALAAAACRRDQDHSKDSLFVAIESSPLHFDPRVGTDQASWRTHDVLYDALLKKGAGGEFLPGLAETWSTDDAVTWRFRLKSGVKFHDGRPCEAADVAFTYRSLLADGFASGKKEPLRIIESIETPSPLDVVFRLKQPYASFPLQLLLGILPRGTTPQQADATPVGTGPWRFVEARADDRVVFTRFAGAVGGDAKLARLVLRVVPDATTRALELLNGSLDLSLNNLPPDLLPRLGESPRLAVTIRPGSTYAYLAFNFRDPVLGDAKVRRALALALDRGAIAHGLFRDTVELTETLLPPGHWARLDGLPPLARDLPAARRLLDEAGFPDPGGGKPRLTLAYKTSTDETSILQATAIAAQWKEAGVETKIRSNDFATFYQDVVKGNFQLFALRWQGIVDPDHYHEVFLSTSVPPKGWNRGFYADADVDRWIEEARRTADRERRKELYAEIQRRAAESLPYVSLYTMKAVAVHARDLTGLETMNETADFTFLRNVGRK
ncbi:MAG: ABC transporter substrate-binding protein [Acidobacteriota bacterium]